MEDTERQARTPHTLMPKRLRIAVVILLALIGIYLCYELSLPFLSPLVWAMVLSIMFCPLQRWLERYVRNVNVASGLAVAAAAIVVGVPLLLVLQQLVREVASGALSAEAALRSADWQVLRSYPRLMAAADWIQERLDPAGAVSTLAQWLTAQSTSLLRMSVTQLITLVLTFYLLFYFLRDREKSWNALVSLSPMTKAETRLVADRFLDTVYATIFGTLVVAAVQGVLGGLMFWWLGLSSPLFWGVVMGMLAIVPVLGAFVVWVPAAIILALGGDWAKALVLAAWGGVVVAGIDNLLYPMLVGNRLKLHTVVAFIGAVGGIIFFGAPGLILGPATITVTLTLIEILNARFR